MPSYARREIVADAEVGVYHCLARCVRRAFLCGQDAFSGRDFEHRRTWLRDRLEELAGLFAIDVLGFAVMANHVHVVLRTRPDVAAGWSDEDVAQRWLRLFRRRQPGMAAAEAEAQQRAILLADGERLAERRRRLASLSWLMRCWAEPIARRANQEDQCSGRFWEGRFKCQALLDEAAVLACSIYVDLNPIRAGAATAPENSQFTGACERIAARQAEARREPAPRQEMAPGEPAHDELAHDESAHDEPAANVHKADWLAPIADDDARGALADGQGGNGQSENTARGAMRTMGRIGASEAIAPATSAPTRSAPTTSEAAASLGATSAACRTQSGGGRRASDRGFLPLGLDDYLRMLDWTGRQLRRDADRPGHGGMLPQDLAPILTRLAIRPECWVGLVSQFGRWFHRAAGRPGNLRELAHRQGRRWLHGLSASQAAFAV